MRTDGRTGGRTYITKLIVTFRNFVNVPKSEILSETLIFVQRFFKTWRLRAAQCSQLFHDRPKISVTFSCLGPMSSLAPST